MNDHEEILSPAVASDGPRRLSRRTDDRVIGGVASGIADYFDLDPLIVRIGFVALALMGASGVLLYLLGWALIPARGQQDSSAVVAVRALSIRRFVAYCLIGVACLFLIGGPLAAAWQLGPGFVFDRLQRGPSELMTGVFLSLLPIVLAGVLVYLLIRIINSNRGAGPLGGTHENRLPGGKRVAIGVIVLIGVMLFLPVLASVLAFGSGGFVGSPLVWSLLFIGLGLALLRGERPQLASQGSPPGAFPRVPPGGSPASPPGRDDPQDDATATSFPQPPVAAAPRPRRRRSPLGWIGLAAAMLVAGLAALLSNAGVVTLDVAAYLALALLTLGAALVVGAFWGRARWLILVGLLLVPFATFLSIIGTPLRGTVGSRYFAPRSVADVDAGFEILAGDLTLDLTRLAFGSDEVVIPIQMVAGGLTVIVPRGVTIEARGELGAGELSFLSESSAGLPLELDERAAEEGDSGVVVVEVDGGVGSITVRRDRRFAVGDPRRAAQQERRGEARQARRDRQELRTERRRASRQERAAREGREPRKRTRGDG